MRGSTALAEEIGASAFHQLINRFYTTSTEILVGFPDDHYEKRLLQLKGRSQAMPARVIRVLE